MINMMRAPSLRGCKPLSSSVIARALLAALVGALCALLFRLDLPEIAMSLEMRSTTGTYGEIFYRSSEQGYSQTRSASFKIIGDGRWQTYQIALTPDIRFDRIRIDPGSGPGHITVRALELRQGLRSQKFDQSELVAALGITKDVVAAKSAALRFSSQGRDPYFEIKLRDSMGLGSLLARSSHVAVFALMALLAWLLLELLTAWAARQFRHKGWPHCRRVEIVCAYFSDDDVLRFDCRMLLSFVTIGLLATMYVALRLHQSSIGVWETVYPDRPVDQPIDIGTPKRIRSDEWRVQTPWVLNQVATGSHRVNRNVGGESATLLAAVPLEGAVGLPQLKFAGFRVFGLERGMSWWWAYKSFGLVFSFFWLCLILTKGNLAASLLGSLWIYFSSFTQWWFSVNTPEIMIAFALGVTGAIYTLFASARRMVVLGGVLVTYAATSLVLHLYPPFIIPLAYLGLTIIIGVWLRLGSISPAIHQLRFRISTLVVTVAAISLYGLVFFSAASETVEAMRNTVYPGQRISESGGMPAAKLIYGFFENFRIGETTFPMRPTNASEASSFVLLFPLVLLAVPWRCLLGREGALMSVLMVFCAIVAGWSAIELPRALEGTMQAAGWSLVTPKRAVIGLGVASILACVVLFAHTNEQSRLLHDRAIRRMSVVTVAVFVIVLGWGLRQIDPIFFTTRVLFIGAVAATLIASGLLLGQTRLLTAGVLTYALASASVNPLVSGLSAVTEKPILLAAANQGGQPGDRWAVIGDTNFAQGLKVHGLSVFAGSRFLPDRDDVKILDPSGAYERIWNRYSTIELVSKPSRATAKFKIRRGDQYSIELNVCGEQLKLLGVTHLAYTGAVPDDDLACLERLLAPIDSGVKLFRVSH